MEELVKIVAQRTGIGEESARTAVETVVGYLKEKLPAPIAGQVDALLGGEGSSAGDAIAGQLGNLFGGES
jgi:hypothetical protein